MASEVQEPTTTDAEEDASPYGELRLDVPALTALLDGDHAEIRATRCATGSWSTPPCSRTRRR